MDVGMRAVIEKVKEKYLEVRKAPDMNEVLDGLIELNYREQNPKDIRFVEAIEREDYETDLIVELDGELYAFTCQEGSQGYEYDWLGTVRKVEKKVKTVNVYE